MDKPTQPKMTMIIINLNNRFIPSTDPHLIAGWGGLKWRQRNQQPASVNPAVARFRHPTCFTLSTRTTIEATFQRIASMFVHMDLRLNLEYARNGKLLKREMPTTEAIAQGIASMLCAHGPEVEWRICTVWEDA
ncbi:protein GIGANTEA [Tanacetum coccineum]